MTREEKEEKEAIELLKQEPDFSFSYYKREYAIDIVLKLIEKQQKEIEKLKKPKYIMNIENGNITEIKNDFISKDKIKELKNDLQNNLKIKEEQNEYFETIGKIELLEEMLRW